MGSPVRSGARHRRAGVAARSRREVRGGGRSDGGRPPTGRPPTGRAAGTRRAGSTRAWAVPSGVGCSRDRAGWAGSGYPVARERATRARANAEPAIPHWMTGSVHRAPASRTGLLGARSVRLRTPIARPRAWHRLPCVDRRPPTADRSRAILRGPPSGLPGAVSWPGPLSCLFAGMACTAVGPRGWPVAALLARQASTTRPQALSHAPCAERNCARRSRVPATRAQRLGQSCPSRPVCKGALPDRGPVRMAAGALFARKPESHGRKR